MKNIALIGLIMILAGLIIIRQDDLVTLFNTRVQTKNSLVKLKNKNEYYRDYNFMFVRNTENFSPSSPQDILNIFYTVINAGKNEFTFYCPTEYEECLNDVQKIANNQEQLSNINNYVHPYNGFAHIETKYDTLGKVTINIIHSYNKEQITAINEQVDILYNELVKSDATLEDNIRSIHDYIINHTKYDTLRSDQNITDYQSDIAYGPLFEGYAVCGGYTDLMELFLEKLHVKSYKVSSNDHIWNVIQMGGSWYHLDLTWDDPVADDGNNYLEHSFFLIDTKKLLELEKTQHSFDQSVYLEVATN